MILYTLFLLEPNFFSLYSLVKFVYASCVHDPSFFQ